MTDADTVKLRQYIIYLKRKQEMAQELYTNGGSHPKDHAVAIAYEHARELITTLFPEVETTIA